MKRRRLSILLVAIAAVLIVLWLQAQEIDPYFESSFDGAWAGSIKIKTQSGKRGFPLVLNLNCQGNEGIGYALLSDDLQTSPQGFEMFQLMDISKTGLTLRANVEVSSNSQAENDDPVTHSFLLKYSNKKGLITGKFTSTDPALKKSSLKLYRQILTKETQKVWFGTTKIDKVKTAITLILTQKEPVGTTALAQQSSITGFGFVGDRYGTIKNGLFDGKEFTGNLKLPDETVTLKLKIAGKKLRGTFGFSKFNRKVTLKPAGTRGKPLKFNTVTPQEATIGESSVFNFLGGNFEPGVLVHLDDTKVQVDMIEYLKKNNFEATLHLLQTLLADQKISMRVMNIDGQYVDKVGILTAKEKVEPPPPTTVSFQQDIQPIFNQNCALSGCHTGSSPAGGLNLSSGQAYNNIVGVNSAQNPSLQRIKKLDPANSYLIRKIKGEGISGVRMPSGRPALSLEVIAMFEKWVNEGAENN